MRRFLMMAAALGLAACAALPGGIQSPASVANSTRLDEQIGVTATNAYTAASTLGTALARAGAIDTVKFKAADEKGYRAVQALRTAYLAGNGTTYTSAAAQAYLAASQITELIH